VDVALVAGDGERLLDHRLVQGTGEELVELAAVDGELAVARQQDHAGDRALALAGGEEAGAALHLRRSAVGDDRVALGGGQFGLATSFLLFFGFEAGALLGRQLRALGLDRDRLQVGAGDDVFFVLFLGLRALLALGLLGLGGGLLLGGRLLRGL